MKFPLVLILSLLVLLPACSSQPVLNAEPVRISQGERYEYWLPMRKRVDLHLRRIPPEVLAEGGQATVEYLIDSRGRVSGIRVIESSPGDTWGSLAVKVIEANGFEPALTNPQKLPVIVTQQVVFDATGR